MTHRLPRVARPSGAAKPKLFLVDDHRALLDRVSSVLSADFEVAGAFTDGREAVDAAVAAPPDVIVLDINMPGLDGFQTMRALEQAGSQAPVVILSLLAGDEYVAEAFRCGARGYVLKQQLVDDLGSAIDQVLHGRLFAPSLTSLFQLAGGAGAAHAMQLYGDAPSFLDGVASFLDMALRRGDATAVVATEDVRDGLRGRLRDRGWDAHGHHRFLLLDSQDVLNRFMRNGLPDAGLLAELVTELDEFRRMTGQHGSSRLTIFGNMVVSLIASGNATAAIELESLWNAFTHKRPFFTLCGYSTSCFHEATGELWSRASAEHWAVSQAIDL